MSKSTLRRIASLLTCGGIAISQIVNAQPYQPVVAAGNKIAEIDAAAHGKPSPADEAEIAHRACSALIMLLNDPALQQHLDEAAGPAPVLVEDNARQYLNSLAEFVDEFRMAERDAITTAGFDPHVADFVWGIAAGVREETRDQKLDPVFAMFAFKKLRDEACDLDSGIKQNAQIAAKGKKIALITEGFAGTILVFAGTRDAAEKPAVSRVSIQLGATVVREIVRSFPG